MSRSSGIRGGSRNISLKKLRDLIKKHSSADFQFVLEDSDGTEVTVGKDKEVKYLSGGGLNIDWTDVSPGSDADANQTHCF